ncbi:MAG: hypothetical protein LBL94_06080 [Prevotellaceae bacterium]|nr:hypothetical protein [Prevotellaceae bacterium]
MKTIFLSSIIFLLPAVGLTATAPQITKQPENATFAKLADGHLYLGSAEKVIIFYKSAYYALFS